jgi:hypothetical protein
MWQYLADYGSVATAISDEEDIAAVIFCARVNLMLGNAMDHDPSGSKLRRYSALIFGSIAGFFGSEMPWHLSAESGIVSQVMVAGCSTFVAGLLTAWLSRSKLLYSWVLILVGVVFGVIIDALLVHPVVNGGERNLWPFEIALFVGFGFFPCGAGLWIGISVFRDYVSPPERTAVVLLGPGGPFG